jgi:hypothetical protein
MKKLHVTLNGLNTLMMHSPKTVNPLHPLALELKKYTSKRKKTEDDLMKISELEWEAGLYYDEANGLHIPVECLQKTLENGAKLFKAGKDIQRYVQFTGAVAEFDIGVPFDIEKMKHDMRYYDVRAVAVQRSRVIRTRPRFDVWRCEFDILYDETHIDVETISRAFENSGQYVGLCEARSLGYGRFATRIDEVKFDG